MHSCFVAADCSCSWHQTAGCSLPPGSAFLPSLYISVTSCRYGCCPLAACCMVQDFKPVAKQLESAGLVSFQPHYLIWVCQFGAESEECKTQCIRNGAYCCPDPDDNIVEGYSGADVLMVSCLAAGSAHCYQECGSCSELWPCQGAAPRPNLTCWCVVHCACR